MEALVALDRWHALDNLDRWMAISAYCDHWCARCHHRTRCLMAGPPPASLLDELDEAGELDEADSLMRAARDWREIGIAWLHSSLRAMELCGATELMEVLGWHLDLVPAKIVQALLPEHLASSSDPDGSAKVAALGLYACITRLSGWCSARPLDSNAMDLLLLTTGLLDQLQTRFPGHRSFRRPGFED